MQHGLRVVVRVVLVVTMLLLVAQLYYLVAWVMTWGGRCDFPEACLDTSLPRAFTRAEWLWMLTNVAGLTTLCLAVAQRSHWLSVARLGIAWLVAVGAYLLTSWVRFDDPDQWRRFADPSAPNAFGGLDWWAAVLMLAALVLYGWEVVRRLQSAESPDRAPVDLAAR